MKKLIVSLFVLFAFPGVAQQYQPIITPGKQFTVWWQCYDPCPASMSHASQHFFDGDTIIKGTVYQKLYKYKTIPSPSPHGILLDALLREDTTNGVLYEYLGLPWHQFDTLTYLTEKTIYDANWEIGDSIHLISHYGAVKDWYKITSIDTLLLNNGSEYYRYNSSELNLGGAIPQIIISSQTLNGVLFPGSNNGGWAPMVNCVFTAGGTFLTGSCDSARYIGNQEFIQQTLKFYPNPIRFAFVFESEYGNGVLKLFDLNGKAVLLKEIELKKQNIEIHHLPNGLYILQFESNGVLERRKLIINRE